MSQNGGPYDIGNVVSHDLLANDHLLSDLHECDLYGAIADMLDVVYLQESENSRGTWPAKGVLFGSYKRPMISLTVKKKNSLQAVNVVFLVDTGAPCTDLSPSAVSAIIGNSDVVPKSLGLVINGVLQPVRLSPQDGNHADLCVLGADYMSTARLCQEVDYVNSTVTLRESNPQ
jgi:hypothetical protein